MLLGGFVVLFLGLAFFLAVLPQGLCASPAIMPTTACVALASQGKIISTILSENYKAVAKILAAFTAMFSGFPRTKKTSAPSLFSTQKIAANSLGLSGSVGIGTTSPQTALDVNGALTIRQAASNVNLVYNYNGSIKGYVGYANSSGGISVIDQTGTYSRLFVDTTNAGNVGMGFTSPFFASPIAAIAEATQPAFPNLSWQEKRHRNPARGRTLTAAARDCDDHSRASPRRKAA